MSYRSESRILHGADIPPSWSTATAGVLNASLVDLYRASSRTSEGALFRDGLDAQIVIATATPFTLSDDLVLFVNVGAASVVNLPAAAAVPGRCYIVKDYSGAAAANNITITPAGADTIQGAATNVIAVNFDVRRLVSDGIATWFLW